MGRLKGIMVNLTPELASWFERKVQDGYTMTPLARHIVEKYIKAEREGRVNLIYTARMVRLKADSPGSQRAAEHTQT